MAVAICAALDRFTGTGKSKEDWIQYKPRRGSGGNLRAHRDAGSLSAGFWRRGSDRMPAGGEHRVELRVNLDELERRIVVCYTGKPRQHGINNWEVFKAQINGNRAVRTAWSGFPRWRRCYASALEAADWQEAGRLMREEWVYANGTCPRFRRRKSTA